MSNIVQKTTVVKRTVTPRQVAMARFLRQRATLAEAALWEALRHRRLASLRFRRQHKVAGFIVDFFCPEKRLVVEVDGPIHETQREADAARDALLRTTGYQVLHITNDAVLENITAVLAIIRTTAYAPSPSATDGEGAGGEETRPMDLATRTGAQRRSEIPPAVLVGLNAGELESVNLVEWLAIDMPTLLRNVAPEVGLADEAAALGAAADALAGLGIVKREKGIGAALFRTLDGHPDRAAIFDTLASHTSDMVRAWAAFVLLADERLTQPERLAATRRFAADPAVGVRECAWDSFRPYLVQDLSAGLILLEAWVRDTDPNIRRFASEVTRPRGVWTPHISALKDNPQQALGLLEPLKSDPSRYVQNSVANWLNDASKSQPDWVQAVCARWLDESPTKETRYIVNRALRTLRKQGVVA